MPRITPEQVKEAYHETGIRPLQGAFISQFGTERACPLTALAISHDMATFEELRILHFHTAPAQPSDDEVGAFMEQIHYTFSLTETYTSGFVYGWDSTEDPIKDEQEWLDKFALEEYAQGFSDGRAAAKGVLIHAE